MRKSQNSNLTGDRTETSYISFWIASAQSSLVMLMEAAKVIKASSVLQSRQIVSLLSSDAFRKEFEESGSITNLTPKDIGRRDIMLTELVLDVIKELREMRLIRRHIL